MRRPRYCTSSTLLFTPCSDNFPLSAGYPDPEVVWLLDDEPLEETERVRMEYREDGFCTLTLARVHPRDSGLYEIRASNHLGQALCSARLTVAN